MPRVKRIGPAGESAEEISLSGRSGQLYTLNNNGQVLDYLVSKGYIKESQVPLIRDAGFPKTLGTKAWKALKKSITDDYNRASKRSDDGGTPVGIPVDIATILKNPKRQKTGAVTPTEPGQVAELTRKTRGLQTIEEEPPSAGEGPMGQEGPALVLQKPEQYGKDVVDRVDKMHKQRLKKKPYERAKTAAKEVESDILNKMFKEQVRREAKEQGERAVREHKALLEAAEKKRQEIAKAEAEEEASIRAQATKEGKAAVAKYKSQVAHGAAKQITKKIAYRQQRQLEAAQIRDDKKRQLLKDKRDQLSDDLGMGSKSDVDITPTSPPTPGPAHYVYVDATRLGPNDGQVGSIDQVGQGQLQDAMKEKGINDLVFETQESESSGYVDPSDAPTPPTEAVGPSAPPTPAVGPSVPPTPAVGPSPPPTPAVGPIAPPTPAVGPTIPPTPAVGPSIPQTPQSGSGGFRLDDQRQRVEKELAQHHRQMQELEQRLQEAIKKVADAEKRLADASGHLVQKHEKEELERSRRELEEERSRHAQSRKDEFARINELNKLYEKLLQRGTPQPPTPQPPAPQPPTPQPQQQCPGGYVPGVAAPPAADPNATSVQPGTLGYQQPQYPTQMPKFAEDIARASDPGGPVFPPGHPHAGEKIGDVITDVKTHEPYEVDMRPEFGMAHLGQVIPSTRQQLESDIRFDMFDHVKPGFGEGMDNKLFLMQEARDKKIIYAYPHSSPGAYIGPTAGVDVPPWQLQRVIPHDKIQKFQEENKERYTKGEALLLGNGPKSSNVLGDDIGYYMPYSACELKRNPMSPFEPVIRTDMHWQHVNEPIGLHLNKKRPRRLFDSQRYPRALDSVMAGHGGATLPKRRSLEVVLP